ncbi:hypothetical protein D046_2486A, partial [Vibrio parahaemolyticus V-223/04]
MRDSSLSSL